MTASSTVLGTLAIAVLAVAVDPFWRFTKRLVTLVHEAGHAVLMLMSGHWIREIVIHEKGGGNTAPTRKMFGPLDVVVTFFGYPAPPIAGLFLALGVDRGWEPLTVFTTMLVILLVGVLFHGNWLVLVVMATTAAVIGLFMLTAGPAAQVGALIALAWLLMLGGFRRSIEVAGKPAADRSDHRHLQELTDVHSSIWSFTWLLIALATLIGGARVLLY